MTNNNTKKTNQNVFAISRNSDNSTTMINYLGVRHWTSEKFVIASPTSWITSAFAITFWWKSCSAKLWQYHQQSWQYHLHWWKWTASVVVMGAVYAQQTKINWTKTAHQTHISKPSLDVLEHWTYWRSQLVATQICNPPSLPSPIQNQQCQSYKCCTSSGTSVLEVLSTSHLNAT